MTTKPQALYFVYTVGGFYLGTYCLIEHGDVLQVSKSLSDALGEGTLLHIDAVYSKEAWVVEILSNYQGKRDHFLIEKIAERSSQYANLARLIHQLAYMSPFTIVREI